MYYVLFILRMVVFLYAVRKLLLTDSTFSIGGFLRTAYHFALSPLPMANIPHRPKQFLRAFGIKPPGFLTKTGNI